MKKLLFVFSIFITSSVLTACNLPTKPPVLKSPPLPWLTYTNNAYNFQLQYPYAGSIVSGATDTSIRIQLPIIQGTNLVEKYLDINVQDGNATCQSPEAAGYAYGFITPVNLTINGLAWVEESSGEGAAGSMYDWTAYSTVNGSICVNLTFVLHSHNPMDFYTVPPTYNQTVESSVFIQIVDTFKWLSGGATTPTLGLGIHHPVITLVLLSTPTVVPSSTPVPPAGLKFIPNLNANCHGGPGVFYGTLDVAVKGTSYPIDGRNLDGSWLRIMLTPNEGCWVVADSGNASGDLSGVRVLLSPPTPTSTPLPPPTRTPTAVVNCKTYTNERSCNLNPACKWKASSAVVVAVTYVCTNK